MKNKRKAAQMLMCLSMVLSAASGNGAVRIFFLFVAVIMGLAVVFLFLKEERGGTGS